MTLAKDSLIQSLHIQCGFSKPKSRILIDTTFELMKKVLESRDDVLISGFRKFSARKKPARKGRNPATGEDLTLDAKTVVTFRSSPVLKEKVNGDE
jgi:integration host factor subunit alpha